MVPFTYSLRHKVTGKWYYGARWSKACHPSDLKTRYKTSSVEIRNIIAREGVDIFEWRIRRIFSEIIEAVQYEHRFLTRVNAAKNQNFYNKHNGCKNFSAFWQNMCYEERKLLLAPNIAIASRVFRKKWNTFSKIQKRNITHNGFVAARRATLEKWASMSPEERKNHPAIIGANLYYRSLSEEKRTELSEKRVEGIRKRCSTLSEEEKKKWFANSSRVASEKCIKCELCGKTNTRAVHARRHGKNCEYLFIPKIQEAILAAINSGYSTTKLITANVCKNFTKKQVFREFRKLQTMGKIERIQTGFGNTSKIVYRIVEFSEQ